jgi:hypothetical protein
MATMAGDPTIGSPDLPTPQPPPPRGSRRLPHIVKPRPLKRKLCPVLARILDPAAAEASAGPLSGLNGKGSSNKLLKCRSISLPPAGRFRAPGLFSVDRTTQKPPYERASSWEPIVLWKTVLTSWDVVKQGSSAGVFNGPLVYMPTHVGIATISLSP